MPLFYQQHINQYTQIAIWKIEEKENFFLEKVVAQKEIANQQKRLQHLAARYLLQYLAPDFRFENVQISTSGKPFLIDGECFSISHCQNFAAVIISSQKNVAIDIEINNDKVLKILHKFLQEDEIIKMNEIVVNKDFQQLPTLIWSAKETMFKWYGDGNVDFKTMLKIDFNSIIHNKFSSILITKEKQIPLDIYYKIFNEFCLTYIA